MRINAYGPAAYAQTAQRIARGAEPAAKVAQQPGSFGALLQSQASDALAQMRSGEKAATDGLLGKAGVQEVVEAVTAAELGLQKVTAVRDRVIAAYQEIMRMPI
jgi:flagellar hook-basal body complex protein FliE